MKPQLRIKMIPVEHWDCGNPDHTHKSESVAQRCISERIGVKPLAKKWTDEAFVDVLSKHNNGASIGDLVDILGVSRGRVYQILEKGERIVKRNQLQDPINKLSTRAKNCLITADILVVGKSSIADVRAAKNDGRLFSIPGLGRTSLNEILNWLEEN